MENLKWAVTEDGCPIAFSTDHNIYIYYEQNNGYSFDKTMTKVSRKTYKTYFPSKICFDGKELKFSRFTHTYIEFVRMDNNEYIQFNEGLYVDMVLSGYIKVIKEDGSLVQTFDPWKYV